MNKLLTMFSLVVLLVLSNCVPKKKEEAVKIVHLSSETFKSLVFNYETNKEWKYLGDKPCIIDFYADWCGPCKMMAPRLEEIAKQYAGKLVVYKVDTDKEQLLSSNMGIQSLPTLLFVPKNGKPQASVGAIPSEELEKAVHDILLIK